MGIWMLVGLFVLGLLLVGGAFLSFFGAEMSNDRSQGLGPWVVLVVGVVLMLMSAIAGLVKLVS